MMEEDRHDLKLLTTHTSQSLRSMSSGERKKVLLRNILKSTPDFILLDDPFDNLDLDSQLDLKKRLEVIARETSILQLISRKRDLLPFIDHLAHLKGQDFIPLKNAATGLSPGLQTLNTGEIPPPLYPMPQTTRSLVQFKNVSVRYGDKNILNSIHWTVHKGEFWQLMGMNGSGKTTLLSMITGDNPKGYGQDLYLFGQKKGTGESIWELKEKMGYFTPAMTDKFAGYHTLENMVVSGLTDSIGLYTRPNEAQLRLAADWLKLIGLWKFRHSHFHELTPGQQRLVMIVRAMVKHPLLLILDEPTAGMDDASAELLIHLVNKMARESDTALIFVSHRIEPGLRPDLVYELDMTPTGSVGTQRPT